MFREFFVREIRGALGRPMVYIFLLIYTLLVFGAVASDNVVIGDAVGNVYKNAPHTVTSFVSILSLFGLLFAAAFCNNAALRDYNYQFHEILFSTPLRKYGYFLGRFTGAFLLSCLPFLGIYLGVILATAMAPAFGWLDADRLGPLPWESMLNTYLVFVLPNMFFGGAIIFWLAHRFRSTTISFVSVAVIIMAYIVSGTLLSDVDNETIAALSDPFGIRTYDVYSKYFTPIEKNTLSPAYSGLMLQNRMIWIGFSLLITLLSYLSFSIRERKAFRVKAAPKTTESKAVPVIQEKQKVNPVFNLKTNYIQFWSFFKTSLSSMLKSIVFRILLIICLILVVSQMVAGFEYFGLQSYPVTYKMMSMISNASSIFVMIILVFFSGELVWRDRMSHLHEVVNATPHHSFSSLAAKTLSLISLAFILHLFLIALAIVYQLLQGYMAVELSVYFGDLLMDVLPGYITYSCLFIFLQVMINNRYLGYFVSVLFLFLLDFIWIAADISTNMVDFNGGPSLFYSDMNGFGSGLLGSVWFNIYWILFTFILLTIAGLFMNRNTVEGIGERFKQARKSFKGTYLIGTLVIIGLWLGTASFVYYNTFILNDFKTPDTWEHLRVDYEKNYKTYENYPLPKLTAINYYIDIFPESRDLKVRAEIAMQNKSGRAIDSVFYTLSNDWDIEINIPGAEMVLNDEELGFRIYRLAEPLDTNATLNMEILSTYMSEGFENSAGDRSIAANGTFLNNSEILPFLGYREELELLDRNDRKKYDLQPKKRIPELQEDCNELCMVNYLSDGASDWVNVETVISTSADQLAI
ncbi:MAG: hypothetical protein CMI36_11655, partial [Owenweeksia sp.]|nr:hypothetical protein [Owenweeksia sp.]